MLIKTGILQALLTYVYSVKGEVNKNTTEVKVLSLLN